MKYNQYYNSHERMWTQQQRSSIKLSKWQLVSLVLVDLLDHTAAKACETVCVLISRNAHFLEIN